MPPAGAAPNTRTSLMRLLLYHKDGMTVEELASALGISRSAVQQHLALLEREGMVSASSRRRAAGRPSRVFRLSDAGYEQFPRRYDLLSTRTLQVLQQSMGEQALEQLLSQVAEQVACELMPRVQAAAPSRRVAVVVGLMNELGYEARAADDLQSIEAVNCVYHHLAAQTRAVCRFDVRLLSRLLGCCVEQSACMADGAPHCLFHLQPSGPPPAAAPGEGARDGRPAGQAADSQADHSGP
ncbi:MAG TPA: HTH domain-containing protein [Limnochordales bacterium]